MKNVIAVVAGFCLLGAGAGLGWVLRGVSEADSADRSKGDGAAGLLSTGGPGGLGNGRGGQETGLKGGAGQAGAANFTGPDGKPEAPAEAARRLMKDMMAGGMEGGPPVEFFDFLQALSACDAGTLGALADEVTAAAKDRKGGDRGSEMLGMMILSRLGSMDPEGAVDRLTAMKKAGSRFDNDILMFIMGSAAKGDPSRAEALIARMPDEDSKKGARMAYLMARARQDPDAAVRELSEMAKAAPKDDESLFWQTRNVIRNVGAASPRKAIELAGKFGNAAQQARMMTEIMGSWAGREPQEAAKWATDSGNPAAIRACMESAPDSINAETVRRSFASLSNENPEAKASLAGGLAGNLAKDNPAAAVTWARSLSAAEQVAANGNIAKSWVQKDAVAASEWISTLPAGSGREEAVDHLVTGISKDDPESALTWASSITGDRRIPALSRALKAMSAKDSPGAERALAALPEGERAAVQRAMSRQQ